MSFGSSATNWLLGDSNGSRMLTPNALSGARAFDAGLHDPGAGAGDDHPVPVGHRRGEAAGLVVERVVATRARRPEDGDLAGRPVRREDRERVAQLLERGVRDLEVAPVGHGRGRAAPTSR